MQASRAAWVDDLIGRICQVAKITNVPTRNVVLTGKQEELIQSLVESGRYQNASEVVREGLRMIERREAEDAAKLQALRAATETGLTALEAGAYKEFSEAESFEMYLNKIADQVVGTRRRQR